MCYPHIVNGLQLLDIYEQVLGLEFYLLEIGGPLNSFQDVVVLPL
jgi:hypothetical protein